MFVFHMEQSIQEWTKQNLWKTAFKQFEEIWSTWSRPYPFKYFEGCLPQILLGPVLNTLSHTIMIWLILGRNTKQKKKSSLTKDTLYFVKSISEPKPGYKKTINLHKRRNKFMEFVKRYKNDNRTIYIV